MENSHDRQLDCSERDKDVGCAKFLDCHVIHNKHICHGEESYRQGIWAYKVGYLVFLAEEDVCKKIREDNIQQRYRKAHNCSIGQAILQQGRCIMAIAAKLSCLWKNNCH